MRSSLAALLIVVLGAAVARAEVIERILAVVDGRPVLLSEVRAMEKLKGLEEKAALEAMIDERVMYQEASRLPQASLAPEEEERAYLGLVEHGSAVRASELRRLARRQLAILKYVEFRFRPQVRATDPAAAARELDEKIEAWVADLRAAAEIRYNVDTN
jgi:hypothetical protein